MGFAMFCLVVATVLMPFPAPAQEMDQMWGESMVKLRAADAQRGQLLADGNYAMFIHWGLYSELANEVDGKTYYGIGEWIMNKRMAGIPVDRYMGLAKQFNPVKFDAGAVAKLAKDAGMKYIVITSKHHEGFAMYHSRADAFNIVDATPFKRDPLKELAEACRKEGIGLGFYYSHFQDWTAPGGGGGPKTDSKGNPVSFEDYFQRKCLPQVKEITSQYGPLELVWFDTPGGIPKQCCEELLAAVRTNQPHALVSGRIGHGLGDYQSLGDMEVPDRNVPGLWEAVDTINDSWAYAWYDENWKTPKEVLRRLVATVGRGGTYMLNIGLRGDGSIPERAAESLRVAGEWIHRYPQVVYGTDASPWQHALPWGDVTMKSNKLFLCVFEWPSEGKLYLPGLKTEIQSARLLGGGGSQVIEHSPCSRWTCLNLPARMPDSPVAVVEVTLKGQPEVDSGFGIDPVVVTELKSSFATVTGATLQTKKWMEKFGEWKHIEEVTAWQPGAEATWEVEVLQTGDYQVGLNYAGEGRLVWGVSVEGGQSIRNQQNSSQNYQTFPMGWLNFPQPGRYRVSVSCLEGNLATASLKAIQFVPVGGKSPDAAVSTGAPGTANKTTSMIRTASRTTE